MQAAQIHRLADDSPEWETAEEGMAWCGRCNEDSRAEGDLIGEISPDCPVHPENAGKDPVYWNITYLDKAQVQRIWSAPKMEWILPVTIDIIKQDGGQILNVATGTEDLFI